MSNLLFTLKWKTEKQSKRSFYPEIAPNTVNNFLSLVNKGLL